MDLKQIQTFIAIVEWGSFSEAAKQLYMSQPTVSLHIKQLETNLGISLINRTTKSHELTAEGQQFYKHSKSLMKMVNNLENTFSQQNKHKVTVGASSIAATYILPPVIQGFLADFPDKHLELVQSDTINVINDVSLGALNVGIVGSRAMNNNLVFDKIYTDRLIVATPYNDHYLAIKEGNQPLERVLKEPFISREKGSGTLKESAMMLRSLKYDPEKLNVNLEINNNDTIKHYIRLGLGVTIISELAVREEAKNKELLIFDIDEEHSLRDFYLVYRRNSPLHDANGDFIKYVEEYFEDLQSD